ncbi:MAG: LysR family transcriptional regulator [Polaromonas sp.]|nr:LysR family transcriptional regulator [Polaromonas sp.]
MCSLNGSTWVCWTAPLGSALWHRSNLKFQEMDLQHSEWVSVMSADIARCYADHGLQAIVRLVLLCAIKPFGFIARLDYLLIALRHRAVVRAQDCRQNRAEQAFNMGEA